MDCPVLITRFSELFTVAVRQAVPLMRAKGLLLSCDCQTSGISYQGDVAGVRGGLHRLICLVVDCLQAGFVLALAQGATGEDGSPRVLVNIGGMGLCCLPTLLRASERVGFDLHEPDRPIRPGEFQAAGVCPLTGSRVELHCVLDEGLLLTLDLTRGLTQQIDEPTPDARGARVWLVNTDEVLGGTWARRLQRLGWSVCRFADADKALAYQNKPGNPAPALVLVLERQGPESDGCLALANGLPGTTTLVYAVQAGSRVLEHPAAMGGWHVRVYPFSPDDLCEFTRLVAAGGRGRNSLGQAMRHPAQRGRVLIVDDKPLNLVVGRGLAEALGYQVDTASSGTEALSQCRAQAPDLMLLDVHMPDMSGLQAASTLRQWQLRGDTPPFPILGCTAGWSPDLRRTALAAGMDECLAKPIDVQQLSRELRRLCTMS